MDDRYLNLVRQDCPLPPGTHVAASARDSGGEEQERSVRQQVEAIREYCAHHRLVLEKVYIDEAKAASNAENRDALNQMLADLRPRFPHIHDRYRRDRQTRENPFGVIFWKSNRLGRDQIETQFTKTDLRMRGITIIDLVTRGDTGDPGLDTLIEAFYQWQDQNLLDEISENVRRGLADVVGLRDNDPEFRRHNPDWPTHEGRYLGIMPGRLPTGFRGESIQIGHRRKKRKEGTGSYEPHIVQRAVPDVESGLWDRCYLAWKMRHEGAPIKAIMEATRLFKTASGYSTFFSNRTYTGDFEYGGRMYVDFVPALIPREWYEEEQQRVLERAAKRNGQKMKAEHEPRRVASRHLLSGLVYCGAVEGEEHPMHADTIPAKEGVRGQWDFYVCTRRVSTRGRECNAQRISAAALEQAVIDQLMAEVLTMENLRPIADNLARSLMDRNRSVLAHITALKGRLSEIRLAVSKLLDALEKVGWSTSVQRRLEEREAEERELIADIASLEAAIVEPDEIPDVTDVQLAEFIGHMRATLLGDDFELARETLRRFMAKIIVNGKAGALYYTFPLSNLTREGNMPPWGHHLFWGRP
jgi:DNA invertase Pin-like site-specific DNA recombinase